MLYRFHFNLFALREGVSRSSAILLRGQQLCELKSADGSPPLFDASFGVSFEEALAALVKLPRLDAEPDGFFVIAGDENGRRWQVDGHLFDFDDRLHRVELHGECPPEAFDAVLRCFGWPAARLAFELVQEGVALEEGDFRRWAEWPR
jgi:hypothetical protein